MKEQKRLLGKIAVISGVGAGIGKGCALMFARQGATVIGCDINPKSAARTEEEAGKQSLVIESVAPCDLTESVAVGELMDAVASRHGRIDVLVNAAATAVFKPIEKISLEDWRATLSAELDSVFLMCKAAWPLMTRHGGSIINFASVNAYLALEGSAALAHCAGKGGVLAMTRQLALEGAPHNIRANTISPGLVVTDATRPVLDLPGFKDNVLRHAMLKRLGDPEDIAWCATFLASDESSWITAADFSVDGGATAL